MIKLKSLLIYLFNSLTLNLSWGFGVLGIKFVNLVTFNPSNFRIHHEKVETFKETIFEFANISFVSADTTIAAEKKFQRRN